MTVDLGYVTSNEVVFRSVKSDPPPTGVKLLLLTEGRVCVIGDWKKNGGYLGWSPLPKIGEALKKELEGELPPT